MKNNYRLLTTPYYMSTTPSKFYQILPPLQRRGILKQTFIYEIRQSYFQIGFGFYCTLDGKNSTFVSCPDSAEDYAQLQTGQEYHKIRREFPSSGGVAKIQRIFDGVVIILLHFHQKT